MTSSTQSSQSSQSARDLHALWVAVRKGEAGADERLCKEVYSLAFPVALRKTQKREDAEEVAQECATKVWSRAKVDDVPANVNAWVYVVAVNAAYDMLRKRGRQLPERRGDGPEIGVHSPDYENEIDKKRRIKHLRECIAELPENYRQTVLLTAIEGMSLEEMCDIIGVLPSTAHNWPSRAREALRKCLKEREERNDPNVKKDGRT